MDVLTENVTESEKINTGKEDEENANNEELITILLDHVAGFDNSLISSSSVNPLKRKRGEEENEGEDEESSMVRDLIDIDTAVLHPLGKRVSAYQAIKPNAIVLFRGTEVSPDIYKKKKSIFQIIDHTAIIPNNLNVKMTDKCLLLDGHMIYILVDTIGKIPSSLMYVKAAEEKENNCENNYNIVALESLINQEVLDAAATEGRSIIISWPRNLVKNSNIYNNTSALYSLRNLNNMLGVANVVNSSSGANDNKPWHYNGTFFGGTVKKVTDSEINIPGELNIYIFYISQCIYIFC